MAAAVTHAYVSAVPDGGDTSLVQPSDWNDPHVVSGVVEEITSPAGGGIIVTDGTGPTAQINVAISELTAATGTPNAAEDQIAIAMDDEGSATRRKTVAAFISDYGLGGGTVTSVGVASTDLSVAGSPVIASGNITLNINNDAVTFAKMQEIATDRLIGRDTAATGNPEEISVGGGLEFTGSAGIQRSALSGDVAASAGSGTTAIGANKVLDTMIRQSVGLSVIGRSANTTGNVADLTAVTDGHVLRLSGTAIGFGTTATAGIADDAVTYAKIQNVSATDRLLGRDTVGAGDIEELTATGGIEFTGTGIQRSALTGDVTASAGSGSTTIAAGVVTLAKMADIATDRLIGRDTAGTGVPEALTVGGGVEFTGSGGIQRGALTGDVTATAGSAATTIANDAVSYAKIQNVSAASKLLGRGDSGSGDVQEITLGSNLTMTGTTLAATGGGSGASLGMVYAASRQALGV